MNERLRELAGQAGATYYKRYYDPVPARSLVNGDALEKFAMLVIQDYENDKRESRRDVMSELGYSRIGRGNV